MRTDDKMEGKHHIAVKSQKGPPNANEESEKYLIRKFSEEYNAIISDY